MEDSEVKPELTSNSLSGTQLIDMLELPEDIETRLKESGIYCVGDLEQLSFHDIKKLLKYDESWLTELTASLLLKGCKVPTLTERSASELKEAKDDAREERELVRITRLTDTPVAKKFRIPEEPTQSLSCEWIPRGNSIVIAGTMLTGGLLYVGECLPTITGDIDPCLVDPSKEVALSADFKERLMGYWPSYSNISAEARRAYINWLAEGKGNPSADIGYVFLYFYGLERRIIADCKMPINTENEIVDIKNEIQKLLAVYGKGSKSFRRYATGLLDWMAIKYTTERMYKTLSDDDLLQDVRPHSISLALGQAALDNVGLPAVVALQWARREVPGPWTAQLAKYPEEFIEGFKKLYKETCRDGLYLPCNGQELRLAYVPASSSLRIRGISGLAIDVDGISDIEVPKYIRKQVVDILQKACLDQESFAICIDKAVGLDTASTTGDSLPSSQRSDATLRGIEEIKKQSLIGPLVIRFEGLTEKLGIPFADSRDDFLVISKLLHDHSLSILPDVVAGAAVPSASDHVVIFAAAPLAETSKQSPNFYAANMALQLASAVAASDGEFSDSKHKHLLEKIKGWSKLDDNQTLHLEAYLYYLKYSPVVLNAVKLNLIKKKFELLDHASCRLIVEFVATAAQADGETTPDEIKLLEKIYKILDLDSRMIYDNLRRNAVDDSSLPSIPDIKIAKSSANRFGLDLARIAQIQKETERGHELLASIFSEQEEEGRTSMDSASQITELQGSGGTDESLILGLDSDLSKFACQLMERPSWSRFELLAVASELGLMPDGALESINEASYDKLDLPFTEGEDPVEINPDVLRSLRS